jgi:hypothetical protein
MIIVVTVNFFFICQLLLIREEILFVQGIDRVL